jgi:hypothetical protein
LRCRVLIPNTIRERTARIGRDKNAEEIGMVEAKTHHQAFLAAFKKFRVPIEQQNRLLVWAWPRRDGS